MRSGQLADTSKPEIQQSFMSAKRIMADMNVLSIYDERYRKLIERIIPGIPKCPTCLHASASDGFFTKHKKRLSNKCI